MTIFTSIAARAGSAVVGSVLTGVNDIAKTFAGSKEQRDTARSEEFKSGQEAYAAEFTAARPNRNWVDSLADALNRLMRPVIVLHVIAFIWLSFIDPAYFQIVNIGLAMIPEWMMWTISAIISFYFVSRELAKSRDMKRGIDPKAFKAAREQMSALQADRDGQSAKASQGPANQLSEASYQAEMKDTSKPLSNAAILEWNRKNGR